jgi:hypothetical protein
MNNIINCRVCDIILNDENKVKKEKICKSCNKIKHDEWRIRKANGEKPIEKEKNTKCSICLIDLNDDNKIKDRTYCKKCANDKRIEYRNKKLAEINNSPELDKICNICSIKLTKDNINGIDPCCKDCINKKKKIYKIKNKEKVTESHKIYYENNKEKIAEYYKDHYKENKDKYMENNRNWRQENKDIINQKANERLKNDIIYKLRKNCRIRISIALKRNKNKSTVKYINCTIELLRDWLHYNFKEGMNFDNYGSYWHIDHVIPCSLFDLNNQNDIDNCFRWTNLQPLEASINLSKQAKLDKNEIIEHYKKVQEFAILHDIKLPNFDYKQYF